MKLHFYALIVVLVAQLVSPLAASANDENTSQAPSDSQLISRIGMSYPQDYYGESINMEEAFEELESRGHVSERYVRVLLSNIRKFRNYQFGAILSPQAQHPTAMGALQRLENAIGTERFQNMLTSYIIAQDDPALTDRYEIQSAQSNRLTVATGALQYLQRTNRITSRHLSYILNLMVDTMKYTRENNPRGASRGMSLDRDLGADVSSMIDDATRGMDISAKSYFIARTLGPACARNGISIYTALRALETYALRGDLSSRVAQIVRLIQNNGDRVQTSGGPRPLALACKFIL